MDFVIWAAHDRRLAATLAQAPVRLELLARKFGLPCDGGANRNELVTLRGWQRLCG